jgi:hypothetical protein
MNTTISVIDPVSSVGRAHSAPAWGPVRYPLAPFLAAAEMALRREVSIEEVGQWLGISRATAYRREAQGLTEQEADTLACEQLGTHPWFIWPEWFDGIEYEDSDIDLGVGLDFDLDLDDWEVCA